MLTSKMATTTRKVDRNCVTALTTALKEDDPKEALNEFRVVVETESAAGEKGDWYPLPLIEILISGASNLSNKSSKSVSP